MRNFNLALGNYYPGDSALHSLDPRLKMPALILLTGITFAISTPQAVALHTAGIAALVAAARIPPAVFIRGLRYFLWLFIFTAVLHLFLAPGERIFDHGLLGRLPVTWEGLAQGGLVSWRLLSVIALSALLTGTTTPLQITHGLEALLSPLARLRFPVQDFALMMMIALRFIPILTEEAQRIWKAQRSRGADLRKGGLRRRAQTLLSVVLPVFIGLFRRADDLALALEARGYSPGSPRTCSHPMRWAGPEWKGTIAMAVWAAAVLAAGCAFPR